MDYLKSVGFRLLGLLLFFLLVAIFGRETKTNTELTQALTKTPIPTPGLFSTFSTLAATKRAGSDDNSQGMPEQVKQNCVLWSEVGNEPAECVYGVIEGLASYFFVDPNGDFYSYEAFYFDEYGGFEPIAFYLIASDGHKSRYKAGDCIVIWGDIVNDERGIPRIDSRNGSASVSLCLDATF